MWLLPDSQALELGMIKRHFSKYFPTFDVSTLLPLKSIPVKKDFRVCHTFLVTTNNSLYNIPLITSFIRNEKNERS